MLICHAEWKTQKVKFPRDLHNRFSATKTLPARKTKGLEMPWLTHSDVLKGCESKIRLALFSNHNSASHRNSIAAEKVIYRSTVNSNVWWMSKSGDLQNRSESAWKCLISSLRGTPSTWSRTYFRFATHLSLLLYCFHLFSINNFMFSFRDSKTLFRRKNMKWVHCGADRDWKMLFRAKLLIWFDFLSSRQVSLSFDPQKSFDFRAERDGSEKFSTHKRGSAFGQSRRRRFWMNSPEKRAKCNWLRGRARQILCSRIINVFHLLTARPGGEVICFGIWMMFVKGMGGVRQCHHVFRLANRQSNNKTQI